MAPAEPQAARALRRSATAPLWVQLQADLRTRLERAEFAAGFPGEHALRAEYGVSRHTVREALRGLRSEGLVTAARGRPPRAEPARFTQPLGALASLFSSVEASGAQQVSVVRRLDIHADGVVAARLGLEESTPLLHLERLRLADGEPLALDRAWLPAAVAAPLLQADFTHTSLYNELATRCGVSLTGSQEQVSAVTPTAQERELLGLGPRAALLAIDRIACANGAPLEWRRTLVRGDRFALTATFSAAPGGPAASVGPYQLRSAS
ncbi:MAG: GntR family transcriptional regulator [Actinomycetota bacterium]|nr:GntR family transcriptional regulator [Actinomycetota bacterium]